MSIKICGIYKATSPSGKIYIGQSRDVRARWSQHRREKKLFCGINRSIYKYGYNAHLFVIVHELPFDIDQETLDLYECIYIDQFKDCGFELLNQKGGGYRGKLSEESKIKMSLKAKGRKPWNTGTKGVIVISDHVKEIVSKTHKGRKRSSITKQRLSESAKGRKHSEESKRKMSNIKIGKPTGRKGCFMSVEAIEQMRLKKIGQRHSEEAKRKISENHSRHNLGKPASEVSKEKNRIAHLGKKASDETKRKMSESHKKPKSIGHNKKVSEALLRYHANKKLSAQQLPLFVF